jgi:hypothetical protein
MLMPDTHGMPPMPTVRQMFQSSPGDFRAFLLNIKKNRAGGNGGGQFIEVQGLHVPVLARDANPPSTVPADEIWRFPSKLRAMARLAKLVLVIIHT